MFRRSVERGFFCFPAMARNRWMEPVAENPDYVATLRRAETRHRTAMTTFTAIGGDQVLSLTASSLANGGGQ